MPMSSIENGIVTDIVPALPGDGYEIMGGAHDIVMPGPHQHARPCAHVAVQGHSR